VSREDKRDHDVVVGAGDEGVICIECGEPLDQYYDRRSGTFHWRHKRRWWKKP